MDLTPRRGNGKESLATRSPASDFRGEIDRLFERFFGQGWGDVFPASRTALTPAIDVSETEKEVVVKAELPGLQPDDVAVQIEGDALVLSGEKKEEFEREEEGNVWHSERRFGSFRRVLQLPVAVDAEKVSAEFRNGVLTVRLPRSEQAKPRRIQVRGT